MAKVNLTFEHLKPATEFSVSLKALDGRLLFQDQSALLSRVSSLVFLAGLGAVLWLLQQGSLLLIALLCYIAGLFCLFNSCELTSATFSSAASSPLSAFTELKRTWV